MAAAAVSMCPPAGLLLGVNRFCARSLVCARGGVPCVLGGLGVFIFYGALRNRGAFGGLSIGLALYTARYLPARATSEFELPSSSSARAVNSNSAPSSSSTNPLNSDSK